MGILVIYNTMRTTIKATNIEHTNAIDSYVTKRMRDLEKVLDAKGKSELARVEVGRSTTHHRAGKDIFFAEVMIRASKKDFRAAAKADDLYAAIDKMRDEIVREVTRHRERTREQKKDGAREMKRHIKKV